MTEGVFKISSDSCTKQMVDLLQAKKLLKYLLQENVNDEKSWETDLTPLLCEYYTGVKQQLQFLMEVILSGQISEEDEGDTNYFITKKQASTLNSLSMLLHLNDTDLRLKHRISLTLH